VTRGGEGSEIHSGGKVHKIPVAKTTALIDPTGCGDAYRAGLLYGIAKNMDWEVTGRIAALLGAIKIEQHGTQNHDLGRDALEKRFRDSFGISLQ
jgi:adenosine kinase